MVVGMLAAAAIFLTIVQVTWDEATVRYPVHSLLVVAAGMTVPLVAWMRPRAGTWWQGASWPPAPRWCWWPRPRGLGTLR